MNTVTSALAAGIFAFTALSTAPTSAEAPQQTAQRVAPEHEGIFHQDILSIARANTDYRRVLSTAEHMQLVVMSIPPGGEIGEEVHKHVEQILVAVEGEGVAIINGVRSPFLPGDLVFLVPGIRHNFINTGKTPLTLYTLYAPPNHLPGRVHATKADADADKADEAFGEHVE